MKPPVWYAVAMVALLARSASGQYESPFRGIGIWYNDPGYVVADAIANSINTDTLMMSNETSTRVTRLPSWSAPSASEPGDIW
jgi:hypothetical protein